MFCSNEWEWKREKGKDINFTCEISQDEQQIKFSRIKQIKSSQPTKKKKKKEVEKEKEKKVTQTISEPHPQLDSILGLQCLLLDPLFHLTTEQFTMIRPKLGFKVKPALLGFI